MVRVSIKVIMSQLVDEDTQLKEEATPRFKWILSSKKIQITHCVAKAYEDLRDRHGDTSFLDVGLPCLLTVVRITLL